MAFQDISKNMETALNEMSNRAFQNAGRILSENKSSAREELQKITSDDMQSIINKLENNESLTDDNISMIKLWIVGDAEEYAKVENNFSDWIEEFKRLEAIIKNYENKDIPKKDLFKFHGILEDATRLSYDIANFLEEKERINKFDTAISDGIDKDERDILVRILKGKLQSTSY